MKINLHIESEDQAEIEKLFAALAGVETKSDKVVQTIKPAIPVEVKTEAEKPVETKPEDPEAKTPAQIKKEKIAAEIVELGGTPPEKGAVAKFQEALDALKLQIDASNGNETAKSLLDNAPTEDTEETAPEDTSADDTPEEPDGDEISIDDVRTLAHALVRGLATEEEPKRGNKKLGACLKEVGAANLTSATQAQLKKIVPLLEEGAGKTLSEAVAESE
jgi:hypothetical protein